jgi:hypothetical protein
MEVNCTDPSISVGLPWLEATLISQTQKKFYRNGTLLFEHGILTEGGRLSTVDLQIEVA